MIVYLCTQNVTMYMYKPLLILLLLVVILAACKKTEPEGYGIFKDFFPVTFVFDTIKDLSATKVYLYSGEEVDFTLPEREVELNQGMIVAKNQVEYLKFLSPDKAEIKGAQRDGATSIILDTKYTSNGNDYSFEKDIFTMVLRYNAFRNFDTISMTGYNSVTYNNGIFKNLSTTVNVSPFTLTDEKNRLVPGDSLYYRTFKILLIKDK